MLKGKSTFIQKTAVNAKTPRGKDARGRKNAMGRVVWMVHPNGGRLPATFRLASLHLCALALIQLRFRGSFVPTTLRGEGYRQSAEILHAFSLNLNFSPERGSVSRSTSAVYGSQTNHQACLPKPRRRQALVHPPRCCGSQSRAPTHTACRPSLR